LGVPTITLAKQLERGLEHLRGKLGRAGFAVTSAGLISIFSTSPSYSASPAFISSLTTTRRLTALTAKKMSGMAGSMFFKAAVVGALAVAGVAALSTSSNNKTYNVTTTVGSVQSPFGGTPWVIPGTIEAEHYDLGGAGVAYFDADEPNIGLAYRNDSVDIGDGDVDLSHPGAFVGWTKADEWLEYSVHVPVAGDYTLEARVSAWDSGGTFHIEFNGVDKTGVITMPENSSKLPFRDLVASPTSKVTWQTLTKTVSLPAGPQVMKISFDSDGSNVFEVANLNYIRLTAASAP
jgi:hypothetical protein